MENTARIKPVKRWPKHVTWLGLVLTFAGVLSYFLYFCQFPELRDFPILNLPMVVLGMLMTGAGAVAAIRSGSGVLGKVSASVALLLASFAGGFFLFYIFMISYQMPEASVLIQVQMPAPDFTLPDHNGQDVRLSSFRGQKVVLVFYRGYW